MDFGVSRNIRRASIALRIMHCSLLSLGTRSITTEHTEKSRTADVAFPFIPDQAHRASPRMLLRAKHDPLAYQVNLACLYRIERNKVGLTVVIQLNHRHPAYIDPLRHTDESEREMFLIAFDLLHRHTGNGGQLLPVLEIPMLFAVVNDRLRLVVRELQRRHQFFSASLVHV